MNKVFIKNLIKNCDTSYSQGNFYYPDASEYNKLCYMFGQEIVDSYLKDTIFITDEFYDLLKSYSGEGGISANEKYYGEDVEFPYPIGSQTEVKTDQDIRKWSSNPMYNKFFITQKLDGVSVTLFYDYMGNFYRAASRGDGYKGKDITRHLEGLAGKAFPKHIDITIDTDKQDILIRGELIIPLDNWNTLKDFIDYKNPRNTVAGFLNSKETNTSIQNNVDFLAYDSSFLSQGFRLNEVLSNNGFKTPLFKMVDRDFLNVSNLMELRKQLLNGKYECDGLVITADEVAMEFQDNCNNPKHSRKFKMSEDILEKETTIKDIEWSVSKDGKLTPVAIVSPVEMSGVTITRVSLYNYKTVLDRGLGIGAVVNIKRSGDVIPCVTSVVETSTDFQFPDGEVRGANLYLTEFNEDQQIRAMVFFCQSLQVDMAGYGNIKRLFQAGIVSLMWLITIDKSFCVDVLGKNGEKFYNSLREKIEAATEVKILSAAQAFGSNINTSRLASIWDKYGTLTEDITREKLETIPGLGNVIINQYLKHLPSAQEFRKEFLKHFKFNTEVSTNSVSNDLDHIAVCFTGFRNRKLEDFILSNGGKIVSGVNNKTTYLVVKDITDVPDTNKTKTANDLGIEIISESELKSRINFVG